MNDRERRELEDLLRRAFTDAAEQIHPAGDGLQRVRERVAHRRRGQAWVRPGLAVAAATVLVALAAAVPLYTHGVGFGDRDAALTSTAAGQRSENAPAPADSRSASPTEPTVLSAPSSPGDPDKGATDPTAASTESVLPDMTTVWPYGSRREGTLRADQDVTARIRPQLRDPRQTAVEFIRSFVGTTDTLVAAGDAPLAAGIGVTVSRKSGDGSEEPVSLVYLVRVRPGDDAPYVVVDASEPTNRNHPVSMTVRPGALDGTSAMTVTGTVVRPELSPSVASIKVELREPGQDQTLASQQPALPTEPDQDQPQQWTATLTPIRPLSTSTGTVAAWAVDRQNHLLGFVAAPAS
ncbi:MAG TPA: hypothetical protein VIR27_01315 [Mycobacteriales bacterium]